MTGTPGQKGIPTVSEKCESMNIFCSSPRIYFAWDSAAFYYDIRLPYSVVYLHTHGNADPAQPIPEPPLAEDPPLTYMMSDLDENDPYNVDATTADYYIFPIPFAPIPGNSILTDRQYVVGYGIPPYNSGVAPDRTISPPITLAFADGCLTGLDNAFAEGFLWPYNNYWLGEGCNNQSECGWSITKTSDQTQSCCEAFWGAMAEGYTAHEARVYLFEEYDGGNKPNDERGLVHVYGDFWTRLHGIYTGTSSDSPMANWRKVQ